MPRQKPTKDIMNRQEAADYLGFTYGTMTTWASTKRYDIKSFKIGRSVRYRKEDLDVFLEASTKP